MNARERVSAAIEGTSPSLPVVLPYIPLYWPAVVDKITPFSYEDLAFGSDQQQIEINTLLYEYFSEQDWVEVRGGRVRRPGFRLDRQTTDRPVFWGGEPQAGSPLVTADQMLTEGRFDVARALVKRFKPERFVLAQVASPWNSLFREFDGIAATMIALKTEPDRVLRLLDDALPRRQEVVKAWQDVGVDGLWMDPVMASADMISERDYLRFAYPYEKTMIETVNAAGMKSIYYFCGDIVPRIKHIKACHPSILGCEESKKAFKIEIGRVREELGLETCLLGNVDAYGIAELGAPEIWAQEIERQIRAGGPDRFILSLGSPNTHDTPPEQVREYIRVANRVRDEYLSALVR